MGLFKFLFGQDLHSRAQRDQYRPSVIAKNAISPLNSYGTCLKCEGTGQRTLNCGACKGLGRHVGNCRNCQGTGQYLLAAKSCHGCAGTGQKYGSPCQSCAGTGVFKPELRLPCRRCSGSGNYSSECRKCKGRAKFTVSCHRCNGSGWYKQGRRS